MADDLPKNDPRAIAPRDPDATDTKTKEDFGVEFEFDSSGMEPGLELDKSALDPPSPGPHAAGPPLGPAPGPMGPPPGQMGPVGHAPGPPGHAPGPPGYAPGPPGPAPGPPGAAPIPPRPPPGPRPEYSGGARPPAAAKPMGVRVLAIGAAILVVALLAATMLGDSEPSADPMSEQSLDEGERAFHQGRLIDALTAFKRLRRFPTSPEAQSVREQGLEAKAIKQIMEAEPSATAIRRLEDLSQLYPNRVEVRDRLGEVRKAMSSGARVVPEDEKD